MQSHREPDLTILRSVKLSSLSLEITVMRKLITWIIFEFFLKVTHRQLVASFGTAHAEQGRHLHLFYVVVRKLVHYA